MAGWTVAGGRADNGGVIRSIKPWFVVLCLAPIVVLVALIGLVQCDVDRTIDRTRRDIADPPPERHVVPELSP